MLLLTACSPPPVAHEPDRGRPTETASTEQPPAFTPSPAGIAQATTPAASPSPPTLTPIPTQTPPPAPSPTAVPSPTPAIDRACPDPAPERPVYRHRAPTEDAWPTPIAAAAPYLSLASPLPGDGTPRLNDQYPYGYDSYGRYLLHNGLDFIEPLGTPLLAVADGVIVVAQSDLEERYGWRCDWYGQLVVIELDERWYGRPVYVLYGHVINIGVTAGQRVSRGEPIAELGVGGATIGAHLHLEVRLGENRFEASVNPTLYLAAGPGRGTIAGRLLTEMGQAWQGVLVTAVGQSPGTVQAVTWSYLRDPHPLVNADPGLAENFVLPNLPAGSYQLRVQIGDEEIRRMIEVTAGQIAFVEIVAD